MDIRLTDTETQNYNLPDTDPETDPDPDTETWNSGLTHFSIEDGVGSCNWPSFLQNSVWVDSDKGDLDFDTKTMSGLDYVGISNSFTLNDWKCYFYDDSSILIMKQVHIYNSLVLKS